MIITNKPFLKSVLAILTMVFLWPSGLFVMAAPVDTATAKMVAGNFYRTQNPKSIVQNAKSGSRSDVASAVVDGEPQLVYTAMMQPRGVRAQIAAYYIFNVSGGFVIVSADDCVAPVIGYSTEGIFTVDGMPANVRFFLDEYVREIEAILSKPSLARTPLTEQWRAALSAEPQPASRNITTVTPLLTTLWDQNAYYNDLCPADTAGPGGHVFVGCVATAMGQIIRYWQYPTMGTGSHSYLANFSSVDSSYGDYGMLSANFGATTYNYSQMPNRLTAFSSPAQVNAVATLLYQCGVAVEMQYGSGGSGASSNGVPIALQAYFGYPTCDYVSRANYTSNAWMALIKSELDRQRPVYYSGHGAQGGHAFVCDGYDANNYFHINWGWSGNDNGYFLLSNLNPGNVEFNTQHAAIIGWRAPHAVSACPGVPTVTDYDNNVYNTIQMGTQCWMRENLRTQHYSDGTAIPAGTDTSSTVAYRYEPNNNQELVTTYGYLYNWRAVMRNASSTPASPSGIQGICPTGWHVPSRAEFVVLQNFMEQANNLHCNGSDTSTAVAMASTDGWHSSSVSCTPGYDSNANNESGFNARPAGTFYQNSYYNTTYNTCFWSATEYQSGKPFIARIAYDDAQFGADWFSNLTNVGYSVRCVKDGGISVTTSAVSNIQNTTAMCGGTVQLFAGETVVARGLCWSNREAFPTIGDDTAVVGTGAGTFTCPMTNLQAGTVYRVRAFATNGYGITYYGEPVVFTTTGHSPFQCGTSTVTDYDMNVYNTITMGNQCWTRENIRTTHYMDGTPIVQSNVSSNTEAYCHLPDNDMSLVDPYGYLYNWQAVMHGSPSSTSNPSGVQGPCPAGWHVPSYSELEQLYQYLHDNTALHCNGSDTAQASALASSVGWNSSNVMCSPGYAPINNNASGFSILPPGIFYNDAPANLGYSSSFWSATLYQANKPYIANVNYDDAEFSPYYCSNQTSVGRSVRCLRDLAMIVFSTVTTSYPVNVGSSSATCGGVVTSDGGGTVNERGVCWSTHLSPGMDDNHASASSAGNGSYIVSIGGLQPGTTYYVRAYAINEMGVSYGNDITFTTNFCQDVAVNVLVDACSSYVWNGQTYTESGVYSQTLTSVEGCDSTVTILLTIHEPSHSDIYESFVDSYVWNGVTYSNAGDYTQVFQDVYGCDSTVTLHLVTGVESYNSLNIGLYPNPTADKVTLKLEAGLADIAETAWIYDASGRVAMIVEVQGEKTEINLHELSSGIYVLKLMSGDDVLGIRRLVKKNL